MIMEWKETDEYLEKEFKFETFEDALDWMNRVAKEISKLDHHPEWTNVYNKVKVRLSTHSAGNKVTEKDRELAKVMDGEV